VTESTYNYKKTEKNRLSDSDFYKYIGYSLNKVEVTSGSFRQYL